MKKILSMLMVFVFAASFAFAAGPYPNKQFGQNLGKDGRSYNHIYLKDSIVLEGSTSDTYETTITVTDPTADRTITFPNSSGTVVLEATGATYTFEGTTADDYEISLVPADAAGDAIRNATAGGSVTLTVLDATNIVATAYQGTWSDVN